MASPSNKLSIDSVRRYIEENGCQLISKEYISNREKLDIQFQCGHIYKMSLGAFKKGDRCPCNAVSRSVRTKEAKTREKVLDVLFSKGYILISFENDFCTWDGEITYKCICGNIETRGVREFMRNKICLNCSKLKQSEAQRGSKGSNWQGGKTEFSSFVQKYLVDWKKESMKKSDYKCVITGERFEDIHHLYPLNKIITLALMNLGLPQRKKSGEYSYKEQSDLIAEIQRIHSYNLGVCLRKDIHQLFHKLYGNKDVTPEDFYEFSDRIRSGEIKIISRRNLK